MAGDPEMLVSDFDPVDEKPEVADIHPDEPEELEAEPFADDCSFLMASCILILNIIQTI